MTTATAEVPTIDPPFDEVADVVGHTAVRLGALYRNAAQRRDDALEPVFEALRLAETQDELAAASGELIAVATVADKVYRDDIEAAVQIIGEHPAGPVRLAPCGRTEGQVGSLVGRSM